MFRETPCIINFKMVIFTWRVKSTVPIALTHFFTKINKIIKLLICKKKNKPRKYLFMKFQNFGHNDIFVTQFSPCVSRGTPRTVEPEKT